MKPYLRIISTLSALIAAIWVFSCATPPAPAPVWGPEKEAIRIRLKADPRLNLYGDNAHTVIFCIYQLTGQNAFNQQAEHQSGIYTLLECGLFDSSVTRSKRLIIQPDQDLSFTLDRAEGAKYVAIVAGYAHLQKERMTRLFEVPVIKEKKGWASREEIAKPGPLHIELYLAPQQIEMVEK